MPRQVRRVFLLLLLVVGLAPGTWLHEPVPPRIRKVDLQVVLLPRPPETVLARNLGPFRFEAAWRLQSRHWSFGGYSALIALGNGHLMAFSDRGHRLEFAEPGTPPFPARISPIFRPRKGVRSMVDVEAATFDPATGRMWLGWEGANAITGHTLAFRKHRYVQPKAMAAWGDNSGPEGLARLADGRFLVLREGFSGWLERERHQALLFPADPFAGRPPQVFTFAGPAGFSPTDVAQMPDGRVLILMRRLLWPIPARFDGRIVIAHPREIRPGGAWRGTVLAHLSAPLPVDNFEGIAVEPRKDGTLTVWLMSDDNSAATQRTLLWRLALDPAKVD